jgi:hypothetical protein
MASFFQELGCLVMPLEQLLQQYVGPCAATDLSRRGIVFKHPADCSVGLPAPACAVDWFCVVFMQDAISAAQQQLDDLAAAAQAADPQAFGEHYLAGQVAQYKCSMSVVHHTLQELHCVWHSTQ